MICFILLLFSRELAYIESKTELTASQYGVNRFRKLLRILLTNDYLMFFLKLLGNTTVPFTMRYI